MTLHIYIYIYIYIQEVYKNIRKKSVDTVGKNKHFVRNMQGLGATYL